MIDNMGREKKKKKKLYTTNTKPWNLSCPQSRTNIQLFTHSIHRDIVVKATPGQTQTEHLRVTTVLVISITMAPRHVIRLRN